MRRIERTPVNPLGGTFVSSTHNTASPINKRHHILLGRPSIHDDNGDNPSPKITSDPTKTVTSIRRRPGDDINERVNRPVKSSSNIKYGKTITETVKEMLAGKRNPNQERLETHMNTDRRLDASSAAPRSGGQKTTQQMKSIMDLNTSARKPVATSTSVTRSLLRMSTGESHQQLGKSTASKNAFPNKSLINSSNQTMNVDRTEETDRAQDSSTLPVNPAARIFANQSSVDRRPEHLGRSSMSTETSTDDSSGQGCLTSTNRKKRGRTKLERLIDLKEPILVDLNEFGQPIGGKDQPIAHSIGILVRESNLVPLDTQDIRNISSEKKDAFWDALLETYDLDVTRAEKWVEECKSSRFRSYKSNLKTKYYENRISDDDCIKKTPPGVDPSQWANLVRYWGTEKAQDKALLARQSRSKLKLMHTAGTKSYAKRRATYRAEHGKEMDQIELFIECHTKSSEPIITELNQKKDNLPPEEQSREALDGIYESVVGRGSRNRLNGYGMGATRAICTRRRTGSYSRVTELEKVVEDLKILMEEQAATHAREMEKQAITQANMQEALQDLQATITMLASKMDSFSNEDIDD